MTVAFHSCNFPLVSGCCTGKCWHQSSCRCIETHKVTGLSRGSLSLDLLPMVTCCVGGKKSWYRSTLKSGPRHKHLESLKNTKENCAGDGQSSEQQSLFPLIRQSSASTQELNWIQCAQVADFYGKTSRWSSGSASLYPINLQIASINHLKQKLYFQPFAWCLFIIKWPAHRVIISISSASADSVATCGPLTYFLNGDRTNLSLHHSYSIHFNQSQIYLLHKV